MLQTESIRMIVNRSVDWGYSKPLFLLAVVMMMPKSGLFSENDIRRIAFDNPARFYGGITPF